MKINVTENKVSIKEEQILNENEYNIHKIQFDFSSEYTDDLVKVALFSIDNHTYKKIISNNECDIPPEVLTQRGYSILGVYAYKTEQDTLVLRYSPSPTKISVYDGSYKADAENSEPITPSEIEQYQQILQNSLQQFQNQYNVLVEETEGDIQAIENELQRKVDEGYFDGEDGFSPIANVIQLSNGVKIEIEDKTGRTSASVFDGYSPQRGVDYWTQEDKEEVIEEATQEIDGKIEEYNYNATEKLNQYNQNSVQKTNDYNTNAEQKMSAYNTNATEKFDDYNSNAEQKEINYNTNANQKVEAFNTNANSKLSEYNSNAETKETAYNENATQKTNSFNTNATNKLTEYNTNHTEKMSAYNSNSIQKINAFNENATQKTEDFDEHTEEIQDNIEKLQTENARLKATLPTTTGIGQAITLNKTAELEFVKPPLPMGNSEQVQYSGKNLFNLTAEDFQNGETLGAGKKVVLTLKPNTSYTLSSNEAEGSSTETNIWFNGTSSSENGVGINRPKTAQTNSNGELYISIRGNKVNSIFQNYWVQLEEGTAATSYEPYTFGQAPNPNFEVPITNVTGDVEVVVENKNLFDISKVTWGKYNVYNNQSGKYTNAFIAYINVQKNKQISISTKYEVAARTSYQFLDKNNNVINGVYQSINKKEYAWTNITVPENATQLLISQLDCPQANNIEIQVEYNTTPTTYVAHKEQTFTFPLGNEKLMLGDYLADDGIHHVRWQDVFDGSEDEVWEKIYGSIENGIALYSVNKNHKQIDGLSDKFIMRNSLSIWYNGEGVTTKWRADKIGFMIDAERINNDYSISAIRNLMNNNPVTVEYGLEEEVIVPYTSAQQEVYNAIKQAISYEEQTNISSNQNAIFNVEAYQDSKVILSEKVDKIEGKGLSTNDFTDTYKNSVDSNTSARHTHANKIVLDGIATSDITNWNGKQNETDNSLNTTNKTITGAINEVYSIARGANQAVSYSNYQTMITAFNSLANDVYNIGQNVMIITLEVPDLWISGIESTNVPYTYTTDEAITTALSTNGYIQVGYYKLSALETQKVNLTDYEQNTNKTMTISSSSTDIQYPSAKAVYDYIQSLDGDEVSY